MIPHTPEDLARILKDERKFQKKSQASLTAVTGHKQTTISNFENSPGSVQLKTLFSLLSALGLEMQINRKTPSHTQMKPGEESW